MEKLMINNLHSNAKLPLLTQLIAGWHHDRNLIGGSTLAAQTQKLLEEFTELVAAIHPDKSANFIYDEVISMLDDLHQNKRIKPVKKEDAVSAMHDALGDMFVVQVNLTEQVGVTAQSCINASWSEIKDRKGKMINNVFVKEEDL